MQAKEPTYEFPNIEDREGKLEKLILYIAEACSDDLTFGAVKLNKILYRSEFTAYARCGEPITGLPYFRLPAGPAPQPLKRVRTRMERKHRIVVQPEPLGGDMTRARVLPLVSASVV